MTADERSRAVFTRDLLERVVTAAVEAALAVWLADGVFDLSLTAAHGAGIAALTAAAAAMKGWLARYVGDPDSASLTKTAP
jgi:hypothetical protein